MKNKIAPTQNTYFLTALYSYFGYSFVVVKFDTILIV